jgi:hypothetical protein
VASGHIGVAEMDKPFVHAVLQGTTHVVVSSDWDCFVLA